MGNLDGEYNHNASKKVSTYDTSEYRVMNAESKTFTHTFDSLTADTSEYISISPDETVRVRIKLNTDTLLQYNLYHQSDVTGGNSVTSANFNLASNKDPLLANVNEAPTVNDAGTELVDSEFSGTPAQGSSQAGASIATIKDDLPGWIVSGGDTLLIEATPDSTGYISATVVVERHPQKTQN